MSSKISQLTEKTTLGTGDFLPIETASSNYKMNFSGILNSVSTTTGEPSKIAKVSSDGTLYLNSITLEGAGGSFVLGSESFNISDSISNMVSMSTTEIGYSNGIDLITFNFPSNSTDGGYFASQQWVSSLGYLTPTGSSPISAPSITSEKYMLSTGHYIYNSSPLEISDLHNGKTIISSNTTGIIYTISSGITPGFSCQIIQTSTGVVTFTGAAGVTMNSYGGLTQIAGRYGSAGVQYIGTDSYVLAGNLS